MNADYIRTMLDYNWWSHRKVWDCVMQLNDTQFMFDLHYSVGSVHNQVVHIMSAEWMWLSRLQGDSPKGLFNPADYPSRQSIRHKWDQIETDFRKYLQALVDEQLAVSITYQRTDGTPDSTPIFGVLMQVVNHGTDHRSQILAGIHTLGGRTLEQDYIHFLRAGSPTSS